MRRRKPLRSDPQKAREWRERSAGQLKRSRLKPVNAKRKKKTFARNFGTRAAAVREMGCLVCGAPSEAAHARARGMGGAKGDRRDLVPLCRIHHSELDDRLGLSGFRERYGIDLRAEAERIATELDDAGHD